MSSAPIQTRFDGGEISQRLSGRFDSELIKKALKQSRNFEPLAQGSLRMRAGSMLGDTLTGDLRTRLVRIRVSNGSDYLVELLDRKLRLYALTDEGQTATPEVVGTSELVANGDFTGDDGQFWSTKIFGPGAQGGVFYTNPAVIDPVTGKPTQLHYAVIDNGADGTTPILYQRLTLLADSYITVAFKANEQTVNKAVFVKISTTAPTAWADRAGGGEAYSEQLNVPVGGFSDIPAPQSGLLVAGTYYLSFQLADAAVSELWIDDVSLQAVAYGAGVVDIPTPWTANEAQALSFDTETGHDRTIFTHPQHSPWFLTYAGTPGAWSFGDVVFTTTPLGWGDAGSNNVPVDWKWKGQTTELAEANWPACVQMYGGRTYYAGEPAQKNRVLASKAGAPDTFTLGSNPGDSIDFKIATKGAIRWLLSHRSLLAGTDLGHFLVTGSTGIPLVGDLQAFDESGYQAAPIQAVKSGTHALFVTSDLRRVRATTFDLQTEGWEAKDLTFAAEHITEGFIKEIHHAWTPDSADVLVLEDGTVAVCTFEPGEDVLAWWKIELPGAFICSAAVAQGKNGAYLWMAVSRNGAVLLERIALSEGAETLAYVDSYVNVVGVGYDFESGDHGTIVLGLNHLAGLNVRVVWNGIVLDGFAVGPRGRSIEGTLRMADKDTGNVPLAGETFTVGVKYAARAVTMARLTKTGKATSSKIGIMVNNSRLPKINGKRPPPSTPAAQTNVVEPLFTGKRTLVNQGWSDGDEITIEQDQPFRTELCAIYAITEVTD